MDSPLISSKCLIAETEEKEGQCAKGCRLKVNGFTFGLNFSTRERTRACVGELVVELVEWVYRKLE